MRPPPKEAEYTPERRAGGLHQYASMRPPPKEAEYDALRAKERERVVASMRPPPKEAEYGPPVNPCGCRDYLAERERSAWSPSAKPGSGAATRQFMDHNC